MPKNKKYYICTGGCGAKLTKKEYEKHPTKTCQTPNCSRHGKPFVLDLTSKKCVPCEDGTFQLKPEEIESYSKQISEEWEVLSNVKISRDFKFKDFKKTMKFVDSVADIAEKEDHHPDMEVRYGKVNIKLTTHAINGLSENDFIVASKIDKIYL